MASLFRLPALYAPDPANPGRLASATYPEFVADRLSSDLAGAPDYRGPERRYRGPDRRTSGEPVAIVLVSGYPLFRVGLRHILEREEDFAVVGEADDRQTALDAVLETSPDIVLIDLSWASPGVIETTSEIRRALPSAGIIVLAVAEDADAVFDAIKAGASAFIGKDIAPDDLARIVRRVSNGDYLINDLVFAQPAVAARVLQEFRDLSVYGRQAAPVLSLLSAREIDVLDSIARGGSNREVASALDLSEQTVKNHVSSILRKLSVNDRTQAVLYAMRKGLIRMPEG
jgi:DNA-binding NarL/FixJ family response regulator